MAYRSQPWATSIPYQIRFTALAAGAAFYALALTNVASGPTLIPWLQWTAVGIAVPVQSLRLLIFCTSPLPRVKDPIRRTSDKNRG
jgi:hypothetical protein